ncbi:MAG: preprotein translocase subunit SecA [Bacteriovoracales bacterium]|nr:preprotein translocase subunit SecA [Bacteriovoracales bacterium]
MLTNLFNILANKNKRDLKGLRPIVNKVNELGDRIKKLSDEKLKAQTTLFKERLKDGAGLDEIMPEAFATVREASSRVLSMSPFDVQIMGGVVMHKGAIAEMKTGEGKTLTATLPLYLNALGGKGVHLVTVNDYLAARDARDMGELFNWLGLSVGCIVSNMDDSERQESYNADITYGTNNEFAFDYLRDNMKFRLEDMVQRSHHYCIVDEVDSILIDEARTPLIISGPSEGDITLYRRVDRIVPGLESVKHFIIDEKSKTAILSDTGVQEVQKRLGIDNLYEIQHVEILHHVNQAVRAHHLFEKDVDYVVKGGDIVIVDEFTGRLKEGSRWSDGLHQAIEAKEQVEIKKENQTLASITFQNYFKLYDKLAGMTGTAETEAEEFMKIYQLDVIVIPTNEPMIREDHADVVYKNKDAKYKAVADLIGELYEKGQPVLVGTITIESSERLSGHLKKKGVPHEVLNAKQHEREADIIAKAGQWQSVTIATNMAGRGTDIKLAPDTTKAGGLYIIGTERHESRRIDNQLRGRSGRQGDPGASKFFLSLEDDLMRIFGSDRISGLMGKLGMQEDEPIEHRMITNAIAKAQKKVETHNFEIRKHLLDFDNVMNEQRKVIYRIRKDILNDEDNRDLIKDMLDDVIIDFVNHFSPERKVSIDSWPWKEMNESFQATFNTQREITVDECSDKFSGEIKEYLFQLTDKMLGDRFSGYEDEVVREAHREVLLSVFDGQWKDHLLAMDHTKEGINLRAYGQKDPLSEYKHEGFRLFEGMKIQVKKTVIDQMFRIQLLTKEEIQEVRRRQMEELEAQLEAHRRAQALAAEGASPARPHRRKEAKVGRNSPCPCGSGKKYKHCHGA